MEDEEKQFLDYITKVEGIRNKSQQQTKSDAGQQLESATRQGQKSRYQNSSNSQKQKQPQFNGIIVFRIDYFNKMNTSYQQIQIFYCLMRKNEKPNLEYKSKFYNVENQQLKIYLKEIFKRVQPSKDLYLYIEMHGFTKTQADIAKHWTIFPLFNDNF